EEDAGATRVYAPEPPAEEPEPQPEPEPDIVAALTFDGRRHELARPRTVLGRSKECDVQVPDPNVSRRHAEVRHEGATFTLVDLDSTNGIEVGGRRLRRLALEDGTRFTLGSTEIVFSQETR